MAAGDRRADRTVELGRVIEPPADMIIPSPLHLAFLLESRPNLGTQVWELASFAWPRQLGAPGSPHVLRHREEVNTYT